MERMSTKVGFEIAYVGFVESALLHVILDVNQPQSTSKHLLGVDNERRHQSVQQQQIRVDLSSFVDAFSASFSAFVASRTVSYLHCICILSAINLQFLRRIAAAIKVPMMFSSDFARMRPKSTTVIGKVAHWPSATRDFQVQRVIVDVSAPPTTSGMAKIGHRPMLLFR